MDQSQATNEQIARDDAHLESLGIKPELRRTLGFLSNFAIAFAFISVSTGSFGNFGVGIGLSGPVFFWTWLLVIGGQLLVALNFAELSSHFPVAGSIYQWSKRLSNRTLGWFTGWFYFWAQVITVSAVAVIVGYVISGFPPRRPGVPRLARPVRRHQHAHLHLDDDAADHDADQCLRRPPAVDHQQYRGRYRDPRDAGLCPGVAVLRQQPAGRRPLLASRVDLAQNGNLLATLALGLYMSIFIVYGFDTAGTFGEETVDAGKQAPRGVLSSILVSGRGWSGLSACRDPRDPDMQATIAEGQAGGFPIATIVPAP